MDRGRLQVSTEHLESATQKSARDPTDERVFIEHK